MSTATQRIPVLVSPEEKLNIARMARDAGLSMGEFLRRSATAFRPADEDSLLENMIEQMNKTTAQANAAIDAALADIAKSERRIAAMERKLRKAA